MKLLNRRELRLEVSSLEVGLAAHFVAISLHFAVYLLFTGAFNKLLWSHASSVVNLLFVVMMPRAGWLIYRSRSLEEGRHRFAATSAVTLLGMATAAALVMPEFSFWEILLPGMSVLTAGTIAVARVLEPEVQTEVEAWTLPAPEEPQVFTDSLGREVRAPRGILGPLYPSPSSTELAQTNPVPLSWMVRVGILWRTLRERRRPELASGPKNP